MRNYGRHITKEEKHKMTNYLKLGSCKKVMGKIGEDKLTKQNHAYLYTIACLILIIGFYSVFV